MWKVLRVLGVLGMLGGPYFLEPVGAGSTARSGGSEMIYGTTSSTRCSRYNVCLVPALQNRLNDD